MKHRLHTIPVGPVAWVCSGGHTHAIGVLCLDDNVPRYGGSWVFDTIEEECDCEPGVTPMEGDGL